MKSPRSLISIRYKTQPISWSEHTMGTKQEKGVYVVKSTSESVPESSSQARLRSFESKRQTDGASGSDRGPDEALRRLEELWINDDEPQLSEEEIRSNSQRQQDELLALEAIYGENIVTLDRKGDILPFQIYVLYDFPDGLTVSTKLQSFSEKLETGGEGQDAIAENDDCNEFLYNFRVQYLPPIVLTCLFPQSYPSHEPPHYIISGQWLDTQKISIICHMLDTIWSEQPGHEVIYQWIEWIHSSAISYLGFENGIVLGPYGMPESDDKHAISGYVTPEVDIPSLIGYNVKRCHEAFLSTSHQCFICFGDHAGTYFIKLPCQHFFCQKCMEAYCTMHVKEGTVTKLLCPHAKCGGVVPPAILKQLLTDGDFDRWESLLLQKTLDMMSDVIYCPRCGTACLEDEEHHAQCQKCYFSFCSNCRESRHVGSKCVSLEEKLEILQIENSGVTAELKLLSFVYLESYFIEMKCFLRQKNLEASSQELEVWRQQNLGSSQVKYDPRFKEKGIINEILSIREVMRNSKQCPSCQMSISRTEGCNKMVCKNCGQFFCYNCNEAINGYNHFWGEGCKLFPEVRRWEPPVIQPVLENPIQDEQNHELKHPCPNCGQKNKKVENNNHICCKSCTMHFCAYCRKIVKKSKDHFGPKGCKQHTVDP